MQDNPAPRFWRDRRVALLAIAIGLLAFGLAWGLTGSYERAWRSVGVHATPIPFGDLRYLLGAVDCHRVGEDPYVNADCDVWQRKYDYPRPWLLLSQTGISASLTSPLGALLSALLLTTILVLFEARRIFGAVVAFLAILSPPVFFLAERGNIDIIIFSSMILTLYIVDRHSRDGRDIGVAILIVVLSMLKLYPISAIGIFIGKKNQWAFMISVAAISASAIFLSTSFEDIINIGLTTPIDSMLSYGSAVLPLVYWFGYPSSFDTCCYVLDDSVRLLRLYTSLVALGLCIPLLWVGRRFSSAIGSVLPGNEAPWFDMAVVKSCLSIFCLTYILGTNYDYRLIFVVGLIAGLLRLDNIYKSVILKVFCGLLLVLIWSSRLSEVFYSLDDIIASAIFSIGIVWLSAMAFSARRQPTSLEREGAVTA